MTLVYRKNRNPANCTPPRIRARSSRPGYPSCILISITSQSSPFSVLAVVVTMENGVAREASTSATSNPNAAKAPPASADHDEADPRSKVKQTAVFKEPAGPDELLAGQNEKTRL